MPATLWRSAVCKSMGRPCFCRRSANASSPSSSRAYKVPAGPDWVHEIKHDGYRLQVRRVLDTVRLLTRRGYDGVAATRRSPPRLPRCVPIKIDGGRRLRS